VEDDAWCMGPTWQREGGRAIDKGSHMGFFIILNFHGRESQQIWKSNKNSSAPLRITGIFILIKKHVENKVPFWLDFRFRIEFKSKFLGQNPVWEMVWIVKGIKPFGKIPRNSPKKFITQIFTNINLKFLCNVEFARIEELGTSFEYFDL
jgi:hypothetical protein